VRHRASGPDAEVSQAFLRRISRTHDVVIFTNRSGGSAQHLAPLSEYAAPLGCDVAAATAHDWMRKPLTGGWLAYCQARGLEGALAPNSFFCGDAAGRAHDFAASDRYFAHNIGVRFIVPQQIFGPLICRHYRDDPHPLTFVGPPPPIDDELEAALAAAATPAAREAYEAALEAAQKSHLVIMVGAQGSGKSTFARRLTGHTHLGRDMSNSYANFIGSIKNAVGREENIVIDCTHFSSGHRNYREIIGDIRYSGSCTIVWMQTPRVLCQHLDGVRAMRLRGKRIPRVAHSFYYKHLEPPNERAIKVLPAISPERSEVFTPRYQ
jgi:hypothetical protein